MATLHVRFESREGKWADYRSHGATEEFDSLTAARWIVWELLVSRQTTQACLVSESGVIEGWHRDGNGIRRATGV